jgi:hypothetical protein
VATAGQAEIDFRFDSLVRTADRMMVYKYVVKNVARKHGKTATFMPKPLFGDNGSGMHTHLSLWKKGKPLFAGGEYAGLSRLALHAIGGILKHARALCALCSPTTNSYKRLVPGYEAPVNLAYSARNRSAAIRIPTFSESPKAKRIEYRPPDPSANPYLCYSALLLAALDGILNQTDPGEPMDKNLYELAPEELARVPQICGSLDAALDALEADHAFLLAGDVFARDFLEMWVSAKRKEADALRLRPHPYEFFLYYDNLRLAATTASPTPPRWPWPKIPARPTTRFSSTAASAWARPISCTPSASTSCASAATPAWPTCPPRNSPTSTSRPSRATTWAASAKSTAAWTCCSLTTSSSSKTRSASRRSSSTPSTPSTTITARS